MNTNLKKELNNKKRVTIFINFRYKKNSLFKY